MVSIGMAHIQTFGWKVHVMSNLKVFAMQDSQLARQTNKTHYMDSRYSYGSKRKEKMN